MDERDKVYFLVDFNIDQNEKMKYLKTYMQSIKFSPSKVHIGYLVSVDKMELVLFFTLLFKLSEKYCRYGNAGKVTIIEVDSGGYREKLNGNRIWHLEGYRI